MIRDVIKRKLGITDKKQKKIKLGVDNSIKRVYDSERQMFAVEKHKRRA